jgi:hypothetical protein
MDGSLVETLAQTARQEFLEDGTLDAAERMVLGFLEGKMQER